MASTNTDTYKLDGSTEQETEPESWGAMFAKYWPLLKIMHMQVNMKSYSECVVLPRENFVVMYLIFKY